MLRKYVCAAVVCVFGLSVAFAEEFRAIITKVDGNKITFSKLKGFNKETKSFDKEDEQTMTATKDVKVVKAKFNKETKKVEAGDDLDDGLKNKMFSKIGKRGVFATIVTDEGNKKITEVRVFPKFGKKKKDNQ